MRRGWQVPTACRQQSVKSLLGTGSISRAKLPAGPQSLNGVLVESADGIFSEKLKPCECTQMYHLYLFYA